MWREKTLVARQRLSKDFGTVVQGFSRLPDSREQVDSDKRLWRGWISVKETSPESEWVITLSGDETISRPFYAMLSGKSSRYVKNYRINILASRQVDDTIKLALQENVEHWLKLEGLWQKLWAELERQGYKEVPALEVAFPVSESQPIETASHQVPWNVAELPSGLAGVADFFAHGWDFAVPPFASLDGRQLRLDNGVMAGTNIHKVYGRDPEGRTIVTLNAMTLNPDGNTWDLASTIPAIQFVLEPLGAKTRLDVVLLERGAGPFLCAVLDRLISAYPQSERSIKQLLGFVVDYCGIGANMAGQNLPDGMSHTTEAQDGVPMTDDKAQLPLPTPLPDYKRKALERQLADQLELYDAANRELSYAPNEVHKVKLLRQLKSIEEEIERLRRELGLPPELPADETSSASLDKPGEVRTPEKIVQTGTPDIQAREKNSGWWPWIKQRLLFYYLVLWLVGGLLGVVANLTQVFELSLCLRLSIITAGAFAGGIAVLGYSLLPEQRRQYRAWERILTLIVVLASSAILLWITIAQCPRTPPPPGVLSLDSFEYSSDTEARAAWKQVQDYVPITVTMDSILQAPSSATGRSLRLDTRSRVRSDATPISAMVRSFAGRSLDLSPYESLRVWAKGDGAAGEPQSIGISVTLFDADYEPWQYSRTISRNTGTADNPWELITIPLAPASETIADPWTVAPRRFAIPPWYRNQVRNKQLDLGAVREMRIELSTNPLADTTPVVFSVWLDELQAIGASGTSKDTQ